MKSWPELGTFSFHYARIPPLSPKEKLQLECVETNRCIPKGYYLIFNCLSMKYKIRDKNTQQFKIFISNIHQSATKNYKSLQSICTQTKKQQGSHFRLYAELFLPELPRLASRACRLHIICTSSACHLRMCVCCPHQDMSSAHCLQAICTTTHGHRGPELSFTVTGICY